MGAYAADSSKYAWCRHYPAPHQSGPGGRNFHLFLDYNNLLCYLSGLCICQVWDVQQETGWYGGLCGIYLWDGWKFPVLLYLYGVDSGIECGHCAFGCGLWSYVP